MRWTILFVSSVLAVAVLITAVISMAQLGGWFQRVGYPSQTPSEFLDATCVPQDHEVQGNMIAVMLQGGEVIASGAAGPEGAILTSDSIFQIASLSKWITAVGVLVLVEDGLIGLDDPVASHLTRWSFPESQFDENQITIRHLLAHTAGLTDGLGYNGFEAGDAIQTLEDSLTHAQDAMPGVSGVVELGRPPGSRWQYSGGGYTVLQLLVEEVTGQGFADAMQDRVFEPIGMVDTSFDYDDVAGSLATTFDLSGVQIVPRYYTSVAAASLYTTADDLALFLGSLRAGGSAPTVLSPETITQMIDAQAELLGVPIWGLGVTIYLWHAGEALVVGHDGRNHPAINTTARLHLPSHDAIVVFASGSTDVATDCGDAWVQWRTGRMGITGFIDQIGRTSLLATVFATLVLSALFLLTRRR